MHRILRSSAEEDGLSVLLVLLAAGTLAYFPLDPGTVSADALEILVPLGVLGGLVVLVCWLHFGDAAVADRTRIGRFALVGALVSGAAGCWLVAHHAYHAVPVYKFGDDVLTLLSVGIATGVVVGGYREDHRDDPAEARTAALAESKWTDRAGPDPVLVAVVEDLAAADACDPLDLEPLATHVEPTVFERLAEHPQSRWRLRFAAADREVCVDSDGGVTVYDEGATALTAD